MHANKKRIPSRIKSRPNSHRRLTSPTTKQSKQFRSPLDGVTQMAAQIGNTEVQSPLSQTEGSSSQSRGENLKNESSSRGMSMTVQTKMEKAFGHGFSQVNIHKNSNQATEINALAFTQGNDIHFASGQYNPDSQKGQELLGHELAHVVQQREGRVKPTRVMGKGLALNDDVRLEREADSMGKKAANGEKIQQLTKESNVGEAGVIQRQTDSSVESGTGVDDGIANGTMTQETIMGQTYTARIENQYEIRFRFMKAYKGIYPYAAASRDVRGVYVKIEATYNDLSSSGRCQRLQLLQVLRNVTRGSEGNFEAADPSNATRRERSGWGDANAPSRGWRVDALTDETDPYYTSSWVGHEGSGTDPAILWDVPGNWTTTRNAGKEFYTTAICEDQNGVKSPVGTVRWGFYIDGSGNIGFFPSTPEVMVGNPQETQDAATRWDGISGNAATGITF